MKNRWARLGGVLGIVYCIVGFVLIFLGWNGAASNDRVAAQMPYLISGGIAGLALVVVGAALMVAQSLRTDRIELRGAIEDLRRAVERGATSGPTGTLAPPVVGAGDTVLAGPTSYHRSTCRVIEGQADVVLMDRAEAVASGRTACRLCVPDGPTLIAAS
jgi:hypothetical protein